VLPAALGAVAVSAIAAASLLGPTPEGFATVPEATTTSTTAAPVTTTTAPAPATALVSALDVVWSATRRPDSSCLMVQAGARVVFERNPDLAVTPASAMKLVTATAVLHELDPAERLRTPVLAAAPPVAGVVEGDLYLVGGGDPVLGTVDWAAHFDRQPRLFTSIEALADRVVAAGVREVRGRVVGDERRYDADRYVTTWPARYHDDNETGRLSALFVNDGFAVWDRDDTSDVPWDDPPSDAAAVLTALLRARGVVIGGDAVAGSAIPNATELAVVESPTIGELVAAMVEDSDNGTAELLVKELGLRVAGVGTSAAGIDVVAASLARQDLPTAGVAVRDGSGLDRGNRVTCRLLTAILTRADRAGPLATGLPVAAQTGTLYKRFLATPVAGHLRAKTGSIGGVASLAGYADGVGGPLTFAQVLNGIGSYGDAMRLQEALGGALVSS